MFTIAFVIVSRQLYKDKLFLDDIIIIIMIFIFYHCLCYGRYSNFLPFSKLFLLTYLFYLLVLRNFFFYECYVIPVLSNVKVNWLSLF